MMDMMGGAGGIHFFPSDEVFRCISQPLVFRNPYSESLARFCKDSLSDSFLCLTRGISEGIPVPGWWFQHVSNIFD